MIIKVTPKYEYLYELRKAFNIKDYENELIIEHNIEEKYDVLMKKEIMNCYSLDKEQLQYLVNMTPLTNHVSDIPNIKSITIALNIYVLRIKDES